MMMFENIKLEIFFSPGGSLHFKAPRLYGPLQKTGLFKIFL